MADILVEVVLNADCILRLATKLKTTLKTIHRHMVSIAEGEAQATRRMMFSHLATDVKALGHKLITMEAVAKWKVEANPVTPTRLMAQRQVPRPTIYSSVKSR